MADTKHYTELGLTNTRDIFKKAMAGGYAIPAYNFNNMEQLQGILIGCVESKSPVILQVSGSARKYADPTFLPYMAMGAVQMVKALGAAIPIALHLDHGNTFELAKSCIDSGFSSVMLDGSHHPFEENAALTRQVVDYAHEREVTVEGELRMKFPTKFPTLPNRKKSKRLSKKPVSTAWQFQLGHRMGLINLK